MGEALTSFLIAATIFIVFPLVLAGLVIFGTKHPVFVLSTLVFLALWATVHNVRLN